MRILIEFWGENRELAMGELRGILEGEGEKYEIVEEDYPVAVIDLNRWEILKRSGLMRNISLHLESSDDIPQLNLELEDFAVRARRYQGLRDVSTKSVEEKIGKMISGRVNLNNPKNIVRVAVARRFHAGILLYDFNAENFEERRAKNLPVSYPITMHPRLIRSLINIARVKKGDKIMDPFCGTGTILIELALMGMKAFGSDIDKKMIDYSRINLRKYGVNANLEIRDVGEIDGKYDAIVTDPPYGRSSSTSGEKIEKLYERAFKKFSEITDKVSIVLPSPSYVEIGKNYFRNYEVYPQRVHKSLTRFFTFFKN